MTKKKNFEIVQGSTFLETVYWETDPIVYKAITAITQTAPARITAPSHGLTTGWNAAVVSVKGMTGINASVPPKDTEYVPVTVVDANTLDLNTVNAADFKPYASGGYVQYNTPHSLAGYTARMSCKDKIGGTEFVRLQTSDSTITLNDSTHTITLTLSAAVTAALAKQSGVYDLELVSAGGVVTKILSGKIPVSSEVTST